MGNFTIPNRPAQSDTRDVTLIEADFDVITAILDSAVRDRKLIWRSKVFIGGGVGASINVITAASALSLQGAPLPQAFEWISIAAANFVSYTGKLPSLFFKLSAAQGIAPVVGITIELCPLSLAGAGGNITPTAGAPIAGSAVTVTANTANSVESADGSNAPFSLPVDGAYVPVIQTNGTTAANSATSLECELFLTYR